MKIVRGGKKQTKINVIELRREHDQYLLGPCGRKGQRKI